MLKVEGLNVFYGAIHALHDVSFEVKQGEIVTLIGANGAGKTTILHTVSGLVRAKSGKISFQDQNITTTEAHVILKHGLAHVPEGRRVFSQMSVQENLLMGAYARKDKDGIAEDLEKVYMRFPRLRERYRQMAGTLSGGEQQMLCVARALMSRPKLLMMDEPSLGLAPLVVADIFSIIRKINEAGVTILLVEQNANLALQTADTGYVIETGAITLTGPGKELLNNEAVKKAYLGT